MSCDHRYEMLIVRCPYFHIGAVMCQDCDNILLQMQAAHLYDAIHNAFWIEQTSIGPVTTCTN